MVTLDSTWNLIDSLPKGVTMILGWCDHKADPVMNGEFLTDYAANAEASSVVKDGPNVLVWRERYWEQESWETPGYWVPGCWELYGFGGDFVGNPTHYKLI